MSLGESLGTSPPPILFLFHKIPLRNFTIYAGFHPLPLPPSSLYDRRSFPLAVINKPVLISSFRRSRLWLCIDWTFRSCLDIVEPSAVASLVAASSGPAFPLFPHPPPITPAVHTLASTTRTERGTRFFSRVSGGFSLGFQFVRRGVRSVRGVDVGKGRGSSFPSVHRHGAAPRLENSVSGAQKWSARLAVAVIDPARLSLLPALRSLPAPRPWGPSVCGYSLLSARAELSAPVLRFWSSLAPLSLSKRVTPVTLIQLQISSHHGILVWMRSYTTTSPRLWLYFALAPPLDLAEVMFAVSFCVSLRKNVQSHQFWRKRKYDPWFSSLEFFLENWYSHEKCIFDLH